MRKKLGVRRHAISSAETSAQGSATVATVTRKKLGIRRHGISSAETSAQGSARTISLRPIPIDLTCLQIEGIEIVEIILAGIPARKDDHVGLRGHKALTHCFERTLSAT